MPLTANKRAKMMKAFIKKVNTMKQQDADKAIDDFCKQEEESLYAILRGITIVIPTGFIQVQGSPSAQANIAPIVLKNVVK